MVAAPDGAQIECMVCLLPIRYDGINPARNINVTGTSLARRATHCPSASIYRHGFEFVLDRILAATRDGAVVTVTADRAGGRVRIRRGVPDRQLLLMAESQDYIGTYSRRDHPDFIERELLSWMRGNP